MLFFKIHMEEQYQTANISLIKIYASITGTIVWNILLCLSLKKNTVHNRTVFTYMEESVTNVITAKYL